MHQRVVSRDEWTTARVALLAQEKELAAGRASTFQSSLAGSTARCAPVDQTL